jgi:hypothetical protein
MFSQFDHYDMELERLSAIVEKPKTVFFERDDGIARLQLFLIEKRRGLKPPWREANRFCFSRGEAFW